MYRCPCCFEAFPSLFEVCPGCGAGAVYEPCEDWQLPPGTVLGGRYFIGFAAGTGGNGVVYRAFDLQREKRVAVKELFCAGRSGRAPDGTGTLFCGQEDSREYRSRKKRFITEIRLNASVADCPCFPDVFDCFEENNTVYSVTELLTGMTLERYISLAAPGVPAGVFASVASQLCVAVARLHSGSVIHGDIAPDNVWLCTGGPSDLPSERTGIKLLDFGSAFREGEPDTEFRRSGKPGFSAPHPDGDGPASAADDVYSSAATLFALLTGKKPSEGKLRELRTGKELPGGACTAAALRKAMADDPEERFRSIVEFMSAMGLKRPDRPERLKRKRTKAGKERDTPAREAFAAAQELSPGSCVAGRYLISLGSFRQDRCIIYRAFDLMLERETDVCEFFPRGICSRAADGTCVAAVEGRDDLLRDGAGAFMRIAAAAERLPEIEGIARVESSFMSGGTAYAVFRRCGDPVCSYRTDSELFFRKLVPAVRGLGRLWEAGCVHGNITPDTFRSRDGSEVTLVPGCCLAGDVRTNFPFGLYCSAPELLKGGEPSAASDVYALGASLYYIICGIPPAAAGIRMMYAEGGRGDCLVAPERMRAGIGRRLGDGIIRALSLDPSDRPADTDWFTGEFE
jgi:serine/threonine protein kinase